MIASRPPASRFATQAEINIAPPFGANSATASMRLAESSTCRFQSDDREGSHNAVEHPRSRFGFLASEAEVGDYAGTPGKSISPAK